MADPVPSKRHGVEANMIRKAVNTLNEAMEPSLRAIMQVCRRQGMPAPMPVRHGTQALAQTWG